MTSTDYLIDITLMSLVLLQIRGRRLTVRTMVLPLGIVGYVAATYLHGIPTAGNDLALVAGCAAVGALLGGLAGLFTRVRSDADGRLVAKAGFVAAGLWVLGTGARLAFQLYASHGGGAAIEHFSVAHSITSSNAWTAALILMALSEVVLRTSVLAWRANAVHRQTHGVSLLQRGFNGSSGFAPPVVIGSSRAARRSIMENGERTL
jgi:hypothetical protein